MLMLRLLPGLLPTLLAKPCAARSKSNTRCD
jgi:hypothetical protein